LRELLWQPESLYPPEVLNGATVSPTAPSYEDQMVSNWARQDFPALAPAVRVPVQFSIAEHEKVWQNDTSAMDEIAALFSGAPRFIVHRQPDAGHNISLGHTAPAYHAKVLAFADECVAARAHSIDSSNVTAQSLSGPNVTVVSRSPADDTDMEAR
jgi:hypothetical protein